VLPDLGLGFARFWAVDWRYVNRHFAGILWLLPFAAMGTEVCSAGLSCRWAYGVQMALPALKRLVSIAAKVGKANVSRGNPADDFYDSIQPATGHGVQADEKSRW
jgi:hypothetical protein